MTTDMLFNYNGTSKVLFKYIGTTKLQLSLVNKI